MDDTLTSPRPPLHPIGFARWFWQLTKDIAHEYQRDNVGDLAASITFWTLLSIPAAVLALVSALGSLGSIAGDSLAADVEQEVQSYIDRTFTDESSTLSEAVTQLFGTSSAGVVTIAALVAVFTLSRGFSGLVRALDIAYEVEEARSWWHLRLVAIGLGIGSIVVIAATATFLALLPRLPGESAWRFAAAPIAVVVLVMWAAAVYHLGPYRRSPWRYDLPGAVLTAFGWIVGTQGFALYVAVAGRGNQVQTTVGAVLLGLTLMYALSVVLVVGAELNDVLSRRAGVVSEPIPLRRLARRLRSRIETRLEPD